MRKQIYLSLIFILVASLSLVSISGCLSVERTNKTSLTSSLVFPPYQRVLVTVVRVVDGDTAWVRFPNGTEEKVRFLGVDTPETEAERNRPYEYDHITDTHCLTVWGLKAEDFTKKTLEHRQVYLLFDPISPKRGYFGRLLAYVYLTNGTDFTAELVKKGYARVYVEGTFEKKEEYLEYQKEAMEMGLGLWGTCS